MTEPTYHCPQCSSPDVFSTHEQAFMVNSGDHYSHMVKPQDEDSKAGCLSCDWRGERCQLQVQHCTLRQAQKRNQRRSQT